jgi:hypothetical protein
MERLMIEDDEVNQFDVEESSPEQDEYTKLMNQYVNDLPDEWKTSYTYQSMRLLKRSGISAKNFMWMSDRQKLESLGIYNTSNYNFNYEE